jgi:hypothetical protein
MNRGNQLKTKTLLIREIANIELETSIADRECFAGLKGEILRCSSARDLGTVLGWQTSSAV